MNLIDMTKDSLVNKLARLDVSLYRKIGLLETGKYKHEPPKFRITLKQVYDKLDKEDIIQLLNNAEAKGIDVIKTENLYHFDGKRSFSLGQGQ